MAKRLALLIGNVRYQDGRLAAPVAGKTFTALADVLQDPALGQFDEVFVLLNKPAVEVQLAIAEFFAESRSADDLLLIYFGGHVLHHDGRPFLALWDTFTEDYLDATTMPAEYIRRRLSLSQARHQLLVLDCTLSHLLAESGSLPQVEGWPARAFSDGKTVVMTAVRPYLTPGDDAVSPFTPALVEGLRQGLADADGNGLVTAVEWFTYAQSQAEELTCYQMPTPMASSLVVGAAAAQPHPLPPVLPPPIPSPATSRPWKKIALIALVLVLIVAGMGGLASTGALSGLTAGEREPSNQTPTRAAIAAIDTPSATPSATATATATEEPTATRTPSATPTDAKPEIKATTAVTNTAVLTATPALTPTTVPAASTGTPDTTATPLPVGVYVARQLIFMRSGPAINFRIVEFLPEGTPVTVLAQTPSGTWYNVELEDGRSGWVYSEMVESGETEPEEIPIVATIPEPVNEFYDFVAQPTEDGLTVTVGHVYIGTQGPEGTFQAELLPETSLVQPVYENGQELGLGQFTVRFERVAEGDYTSTAVRLCMVSAAGNAFFCETYPVLKEW